MRHQQIIERMTLAQKCAILSGRDTWSTRPVESAGVPSIVLSDGPSGVRRQLGASDHLGLNVSEKATCFPSAATVANSWDVELAETVGEALGREAASLKVDVLLGPGLNMKRSPLCGRNFEYFAEDPYLAGKMAAAYIRGIQKNGVSACPKHFAANSQETHRMASDSIVDERTLRELYLTNFEIAVTEGKPRTIMTSYNALNGVYTNEDEHLLTDVLRREWGFDGMVVTDWGGSNDFVAGVRAGSNLEMPCAGDDSACQLYAAVKAGRIAEETVDARVDELLDVILWASKRTERSADLDADHAIAREAAERSAVLLKNDGGLLPLNKQAKIALIGDFANLPRYQGAGSSMVNSARLPLMCELASGTFPNVTYAPGFTREDKGDAALASAAIGLAKDADAVLLCLGLPEVFEAEGMERQHMRIPENQIRLLHELHAVNPNIAVLFSGGSAVEMPWLADCKALLWLGLGGQAGAEAALRLVSGEVCPGGKMTETFVKAYADLPVSQHYPAQGRTAEYREGLFVGYRYTESENLPVTFPFGHGLSYTTFAYAEIEANAQQVSFNVTNTGKRDGDEIAQLYVTGPGHVLRPAKELKGFLRVHLKAGETKRVTIPLDDKAFRYYNVETARWEVEGGAWQLHVGASIRDIRLTAQVEVQGSNAPIPATAKPGAKPRDLHRVTDAEFTRMLGHAIPPGGRDPKQLSFNDPLDAMVGARNPIARLAAKVLLGMRDRSIRKGKPDLNILFITNIPFRGIAKMMNGMVTVEMAQALVDLVNNRWGKGLGGLIRGLCRKPNLRKLEERT